MARHLAAVQGHLDDAGDGLMKASSALGRTVLRAEVTDVLDDYKRLTTDEARARFADHFLGRTAGVMDEIWPTFYELLKCIEDGEFYRDPAYLGEDRTFATFKEYFEHRVGRPFETWSEMESTYHYAQKYAPDLLRKAFAVARGAKERVTKGAQALAKAIRDEHLVINSGSGPLAHDETANLVNNTISVTGGSDTRGAEYLMRRIARDHPVILQRACDGEFPSARAAAIEAGIAPRTQSVRMDDAESAARTIRKHMPPDTRRALARLLIDD